MLIYAFWRGLSNRPARETFIACSGSGDCGGQVQGEACGGLIAEGRVGPRGVVVGDPVGNELAGMGKVAEQRLIQEFVPHPAVDGEDGPAPEKGPYTGPTLQKEHSHEPSHRGP